MMFLICVNFDCTQIIAVLLVFDYLPSYVLCLYIARSISQLCFSIQIFKVDLSVTFVYLFKLFAINGNISESDYLDGEIRVQFMHAKAY